MSRFLTSEREIANSFLRNLGVELDDTQQEFLGATIGEIQRRIQLNNDEPVDNAVVRLNYDATGLSNRYLRSLIDHVRGFSLAGRVAEIPDESNSAGVSSLTNPILGSSADGEGDTNDSNETVADGQAVPAAHSNWSVDAVAGSAAPSQITDLTAETEDTSTIEGGDHED